MATLVINGAAFTQGKRTADRIASEQGLTVVTDDDILSLAADRTGVGKAFLENTLTGKPGFFNTITRDRERAVASVRAVVAEKTAEDNTLFFGLFGLFIPSWVSHVARILVTGEKPFRIIQAVTHHKLSEKEAMDKINQADADAFLRSQALFAKPPVDKSLYDLVIHADKLGENGAYEMIMKHMTKYRRIALETITDERTDFRLAADIWSALAFLGGITQVRVEKGQVEVVIKKNTIFPSRLKLRVLETVKSVEGVAQAAVRLESEGGRAWAAPRLKTEKTAPVLLVDDEKKYVETLSERLKIRKVETKVTYSGEDALGYLDKQDADVMVLDLKMPGIDGFEVLRRIKATKPEVEVIILTGQASDFDRKTCLDLGAFAFLERPVDIDVLTETMRNAHEKIRLRKSIENQEND